MKKYRLVILICTVFLRVEMDLNGQMAGIYFSRSGLKMRLVNIIAHSWTYMDYGTLGNAIHVYHFYVNVLQVNNFPTVFSGATAEAECDLSILVFLDKHRIAYNLHAIAVGNSKK